MLRAEVDVRRARPSRGRLVEVGNDARPDRDVGEGTSMAAGRPQVAPRAGYPAPPQQFSAAASRSRRVEVRCVAAVPRV